MRLQTFALVVVVIMAVGYLIAWFFGALSAGPFGWLLLIPMAIVLILVVGVIIGRVGNKEDDHYDNIEK